jgi:DedD protein
LSTRLKGDGYKAFVHSVVIDKGRVYRVLVGPKIDHLKAQQIKDELDAVLKVSSILVKFQP